MIGGSTISGCGRYRYELTRMSSPRPWRWVTFVMLNPSTADGFTDDPTIRRCIKFADSWDADALQVLNLYAYRATDPSELARVADPVGPQNDEWLARELRTADAEGEMIVAAWGAKASPERVRQVLDLCDVHWLTLGVTKDGHPKHPLARGRHRVPDDAQPVTWRRPD